MSIKTVVISPLFWTGLIVVGLWLVLGYGSYRNVEQFDAMWPVAKSVLP